MSAQCDFSKHSGIFTLGNSHPLIVNPVFTVEINDGAQKKKKKKKKKREREREGGRK